MDGLRSGFDDFTSGNWSGVARGIGEFSSDYLAPKGIPSYNLLTGETTTPEGLPGLNVGPSRYVNLAKDGLKDVPEVVSSALKDVAGQFWDVLKKYWYIPVIVGGVVVGYLLIRSKNGRTQVIKYLAAQ